MRSASKEQREWILFGLLLLLGLCLMLIAGQFALIMPRNWQANNTNMDSNLRPNDVFLVAHQDETLKLAPIRTDIPVFFVSTPIFDLDLESITPPPPVEFKTPLPLASSTPRLPGSTATTAHATASATSVVKATASNTPVIIFPATSTKIPTALPTSVHIPTATKTVSASTLVPPSSTATATASLTASLTPTNTNTNTPVPPTATNTSLPPTDTDTPVPPTATDTSLPPTDTDTPVPPTSTDTPVPPTATDTPGAPVTICGFVGGGNYNIPPGGCWIVQNSPHPGRIYTFTNLDASSSLDFVWFGLDQNQTSGSCNFQGATLGAGGTLTNIAVVRMFGVSAVSVMNYSASDITVNVALSAWSSGGCN